MLWIGDHQGRVLERIDPAVVGAVAAPLPYLHRNRAALRRARRELGLSVMYDVEAWRNQRPLGHRLRRDAWQKLGMDSTGVYQPDEIASR